MNKNKWLRLLLFIPLLLLVPLTNYFVDPASLFHVGEEKKMAELILAGNNVNPPTANFDEREVKKQLIINMPEHVKCVVIGTSLVMEIDRDIVKEDSFYNLALSGAELYDYLPQFALIDGYDKKIDKIILSFDSWCFDRQLISYIEDIRKLTEYSDYFIDKINENDNAVFPEETKQTESFYFENIKQLFSLSYFQSSLNYLFKRGLRKPVGVVSDDYEYEYYKSDASWHSSQEVLSREEDYVIEDANYYDTEHYFTPGEHIDAEYREIFEKSIDYLVNEKGIEIVLFMCPLSPALWEQYDEDEMPILPEMEDFAQEFADKYGVKLVGSFNPHDIGVSNSDFYDCRHMRSEAIDEFFDFN